MSALRSTRIAVQFLTRIPVGPSDVRTGELRAATGAFPLVGVLVAGIVVGVRWLFGLAIGDLGATVLAVSAGVVATGAFHEDGFADAADGLWGGATPEDRLRIMRDPRHGTYGVVALVLLMALKIALLAPLSLEPFTRAVVAGAVLGRASSLPLMRRMPAAADSSAALAGVPSGASLAVGGATSVVIATLTFGWWAWLPLVAAGAVIVLSAAIVRRKLGGINGDVLGATNQVVEVTTYVCAAGLALRGMLG
jgi:adenosylcobinamide-GDP ribazoletransferase